LQQLDWASNCMTLKLRDTSVERDPTVHGGEETKCAFTPDVGGLDRCAILKHRQQGKNGALRKIGVLEKPPRIADHVTEFELDRLQMLVYPLAAGGLQRAK
jgi:hypothetical protein